MSRITRPVADEDTIKMVGYFVDRVVVREGCDTRASANQTSEDILETINIDLQTAKAWGLTLFDAAIDDSHVEIAMG